MKTTISFILLCFLGLQMHAQPRKSDLSPEDQARLQSKKMALALDLSEAQRLQVEKIQLNEILFHQKMKQKRKASVENGNKLTKEQRAEGMEMMLDRKLALQNQMKSTLSEDQFQKWKKIQMRKHRKTKKKVRKKIKKHS